MSEIDQSLLELIESREASIGVLGLGYVGLPLSLAFTDAGFAVKGFDIDDHRIGRLRRADSHVDDVSDESIQAVLDAGFVPGASPSAVADCDVYLIAVPTGMTNDEPDMAAVEAAAETIARQAPNRETLVIVSSTVYPGATREIVRPIVETNQDHPTHLSMVPERLNPGSGIDFHEIPLVIGADTEPARSAATALFDEVVVETHPVDSTETAELTKTLENTYRMVNIALVNELVKLTEGLDADVWEAIDAAATKPFGFQPFRPGPGVGGHCIPIDPQFLTWRARELGAEIPFLDDAHHINEGMPALVVDRLEKLLRVRGVELRDASIVALGAAYKSNVGDTRNSPALRVVDRLPATCDITIVDPHTEALGHPGQVVSGPEDAELGNADAVLLLVNHDAFNLHAIGEEATFVFDTRNAMPEGVTATVVTLGQTDGRTDRRSQELTGSPNW